VTIAWLDYYLQLAPGISKIQTSSRKKKTFLHGFSCSKFIDKLLISNLFSC